MSHVSPHLLISVPNAIGYCITFSIIELFCCSLYFAARDGLQRLHRLHQVPCSRCAFFTGDYTLKCTVQPRSALTEAAINCYDFEPMQPVSQDTTKAKTAFGLRGYVKSSLVQDKT
jgi:hypothetical protein